jgi:hypothetical protein
MDDNEQPCHLRKLLGLWVPAKEHEAFRQEAETYGYDISTLLRLRIFGKVRGMRITRRPSTDMMLLGEIIGKLAALTSEVNKLGSNLNQIAKRLNQGSRDTFGLDSCLRLFEQIGQKIFRVLNLIEATITGHNKFNRGD